MPEFKKAYVTIMVDNLDKSVEFYNGLLGLYEDLRFGDSWAEMTTKGLVIGLHPKKIGAQPNYGASSTPAGHNQGSPLGLSAEGQVHPGIGDSANSRVSTWGHEGISKAPPKEGPKLHPVAPAVSIGFEVEDIRKTSKELEAKGIRFHFQENDVNILAFFMDPDGTPLYLTQVR